MITAAAMVGPNFFFMLRSASWQHPVEERDHVPGLVQVDGALQSQYPLTFALCNRHSKAHAEQAACTHTEPVLPAHDDESLARGVGRNGMLTGGGKEGRKGKGEIWACFTLELVNIVLLPLEPPWVSYDEGKSLSSGASVQRGKCARDGAVAPRPAACPSRESAERPCSSAPLLCLVSARHARVGSPFLSPRRKISGTIMCHHSQGTRPTRI